MGSEIVLRLVKWSARIFCIIFILFIGMFGFDVFGSGHPFIRELGAFLIHEIPVFVMTVILLFSWKRPLIGSIFFLVLAVSYILWTWHSKTYLIIAAPLLITSILFLLNWWIEKPLREKTPL